MQNDEGGSVKSEFASMVRIIKKPFSSLTVL